MSYHAVKAHPEARIAPNATVIGDVTLEKDTLVLFNAVLRGDCGTSITIGEGTNLQEGCCVHVSAGAPCVVGKRVTVGHGAILHGCTVEDESLIGMGAVVLDGAVIGEGSLIAAGAVVTGGTVVPPGSLAMGAPAKVRRALSAEERDELRVSAEEYIRVGCELARDGIVYEGASLPRDIPTIALAREDEAES